VVVLGVHLSVRLRLTRLGRKKRPYYRIIAVDSRAKRDGSYIERIGYYHPLENPPDVLIEGDKALKWLRNGAKPSETVLSLLKREGVWLRFRLERRGLPQAQIDSMMQDWFKAHHKAAPVVQPPEAAAPAAEPVEPTAVETAPETTETTEPVMQEIAVVETSAAEPAEAAEVKIEEASTSVEVVEVKFEEPSLPAEAAEIKIEEASTSVEVVEVKFEEPSLPAEAAEVKIEEASAPAKSVVEEATPPKSDA